MLHIVYPTGHMDIRMDKFFPCTLDCARKLFRLMAQHSPAEDQHRLLEYLRQREEKFKSQVENYSRQAAEATKRHEVSKYESFARNAENQRHRTKRNIELLCQICRLGVSK